MKRLLQNIKTWLRLVRVIQNWPSHYWWKWRKPERAVYRMRNGVRFTMRPGSHDKLALKEVWIHNLYFPKSIQLHEDDVVIDVGAHIGTFALLAAHKVPRGKVYAYEPEPDNFKLLCENITLNGNQNAQVRHCAVSAKSGPIGFWVTPRVNVGHSVIRPMGKSHRIEIESVTLEQVMRENGVDRVGYLKVDCEGSEYDLLMSTPVATLRKIQQICVETDPVDVFRTPDRLEDFLKNRGFELTRRVAPHGGIMFYGHRN